MKEQKYIIENQESFELKDVFECGQCFRWNKNEDGSYTGVINKGVLNVEKTGNQLIFTGILSTNIQQIVDKYFDLSTNYEEIKTQLANIDKYLRHNLIKQYLEKPLSFHMDNLKKIKYHSKNLKLKICFKNLERNLSLKMQIFLII